MKLGRDEARGKSPGTPGAREENKGKARKMCLTWQRQFFSQSCRLNARRRKAIGSREEPVGKMAAISLQPPVEVSPLPPTVRHSVSVTLNRGRGGDLRKKPRSRNKGGEHRSETLILINCLIFPRDVRDALSCADLVYISLERHEDAASSLRSIQWGGYQRCCPLPPSRPVHLTYNKNLP